MEILGRKDVPPVRVPGRNRAPAKSASAKMLIVTAYVPVILPDSDWIAMVEALAREIVNSTGGQIDLGQARSVADAQLEVLKVCSISTAVVTQILAGCDHSDCGPPQRTVPFRRSCPMGSPTAQPTRRTKPF